MHQNGSQPRFYKKRTKVGTKVGTKAEQRRGQR